jgi:hypothetical protein
MISQVPAPGFRGAFNMEQLSGTCQMGVWANHKNHLPVYALKFGAYVTGNGLLE